MIEVTVTELLMCKHFIPPEWFEAKTIIGKMRHEEIQEKYREKGCESEVRLEVQVSENVKLVGKADIICQENGETVIYEIKPLSNNREAIRRYTTQLQMYLNMYKAIYGVIPKGVIIYYNRQNKVLTKQSVFYEDILEEMKSVIIDYANWLQRGDIYIRNPFCGICQYKETCPLRLYPYRKVLVVQNE